MKTTYTRRMPRKRDTVSAAAVSIVIATGVGTLAYYFTRLLLARDAMTRDGETESTDAPRS